jgi:dipeptidase D
METVLRKEYGSTAPELRLIVREQMSREFGAQKEFSEGTEIALGAPLTKESFRKLCAMLRVYPNGIIQMSGALPGLVESSDNIGIIEMEENHVRIETEVRGAYKSTIEDIKKSIDTVAEVFGAEVRYFDAYVPWEPEEDSPMRQLAAETYRQLYDRELQQIALHAGLECGFFAAKIPGLEIISIGPDSQCFHSPEERVHVGSVLRVYEFLKTLLARC